MVEGSAALPLADKLARVGTTGILPVIMCALLNCACVAAVAVTLPAPNRPAPTDDTAPAICASLMCATFENSVPPCSGAIPPKRLTSPNRLNATTPKRPPYPPHHGKNRSQGPIGNQPKPPHPPHPKPKPNPHPPPKPKNDTYAGAQNGR